jgi:spore germination protein YaaH
MKLIALLLLCIELGFSRGWGQHKSIHQLESEAHRNERLVDVQHPSKSIPLEVRRHAVTSLSKKVFGWHPYWAPSTAYLGYDYSVLSHIGYFSYETDTATGSYTTLRGWTTTPMIDTAHNHGVKVALVVTNFGYDNNDKFLGNPAKQTTMIDTLIHLLESRNGDGVNLDFEEVRGTQRSNLVQFIQLLATQVKARIPAAEISMATPAVDWDNAFDLLQLSESCDYLILMGYDYYYAGSATAGPVAPLVGDQYTVSGSVNSYLSAGVSAGRLLLGVPWYGYDWPVMGSRRKSPATGSAASYPYRTLEPEAESYGKIFDSLTEVPWFSYQSMSQWHQAWYEDSTSLALKYQFAISKNLGGIGIWALSYQSNGPELWNGIRNAFPDTGVSGMPGIERGVPVGYALGQNFPNPFNSTTTVEFLLARESQITVRVMDVLGHEVVTLLGDLRAQAGIHRVSWNGLDSEGNGVASGVYFYRLNVVPLDGSPVYISAREMLLLK